MSALQRKAKRRLIAFGNHIPKNFIKEDYAAFTILPDFMQRVHTFIRPLPPAGSWTRTGCKLGLKRRRVLLFACETLFPNCGPLPHTSHRLAIN
jgi:hypothetical protein